MSHWLVGDDGKSKYGVKEEVLSTDIWDGDNNNDELGGIDNDDIEQIDDDRLQSVILSELLSVTVCELSSGKGVFEGYNRDEFDNKFIVFWNPRLTVDVL